MGFFKAKLAVWLYRPDWHRTNQHQAPRPHPVLRERISLSQKERSRKMPTSCCVAASEINKHVNPDLRLPVLPVKERVINLYLLRYRERSGRVKGAQ